MSERFNLAELVADVCRDANTCTDPTVLAKEVHRRIPSAAYGDALAQALRTIVCGHIRRSAAQTKIVAPGATSRRAVPSAPAVAGPDRLTAVPAPPRMSPKIREQREWWQKALQDRIKTGDAPNMMKLFGDCTAADLDYAAGLRRSMAEANTQRAVEFEIARDTVRAHHVQTVGDLPEAVLIAMLQRRRVDAA